MTFAHYEESRTLGRPDELFRFSYGDMVIGYTDAEEGDTVDGVTYQPIAIDRDAMNSSGTMDKSALIVRMPHDEAIPELFRVFPPSEIVALTIFQRHDDEEALTIWVGRVLSCKLEQSEAALTCEPISTSMKRPGLRIRDQYSCMHALYGASCRALRANFTVSAAVSTVSGRFVTLSPGWAGAFAPTKFTNGIIKWGNEQRQILKVEAEANRLQIGGTLPDLDPGMSVELSLGCQHTMSDCTGTFGNVHNFGGCPFIPKRNPIGFVNQFY